MPKESAILSATAITSKDPITLALGLPEVSNPKIIPKLVTVDDVAPKLNLLGSFGIFIKEFPCMFPYMSVLICVVVGTPFFACHLTVFGIVRVFACVYKGETY